MAIAEIKWKLVKDTYFFDTTTCYLSEDGNHMFYSGGEKRIEILIDDLNELVRKGCAMWLKLGEYEFGLDKLSKCPTTTWYSINQMLYSLEPWGVMKESKKLARKSLKEEKEIWIIKSKDDLQYVGKKIFDVCEDIENARKFKSKFEAEEFLKKHDKALDYRYWKVINIDSESKESVRKSIKESVEFFNDWGTGVYCATSSNGWTFCYCPLSWINKKGVEDLIGWSVMDDKDHYIEGDSWENKTDEEINDSIDNFEKLIKKYAKEDAKEIIKDFRSTLDKD